MNWNWLKDLILEVLRYLFVWNKQGDAAPIDKDDKKFDDEIKKDGW